MTNDKKDNRPNTNPSPKQILLSSKDAISKHRELMQNPVFIQALQMAEGQYLRSLTDARTIEGNTAAANFFKLSGMQEFISVLKNLAEPGNIPTTTVMPSLDHKV